MLRSECLRILREYEKQFNSGISDFLDYCKIVEKLNYQEIDIVLAIAEEEGII